MKKSSGKALTADHSEGRADQQAIPANLEDTYRRDPLPPLDWSLLGDADHFVQFYEADAFLLDRLCDFAVSGLKAGDALVIVATKEHLEGFEQRLRTGGYEPEAVEASGQMITLDAAVTLSQFMVAGEPVMELFDRVIGKVIEQASASNRQVRVFGEMVALLWSEGKHQEAIHLEKMLNILRQTSPFSLICAYPIHGFDQMELTAQLKLVCGEHSRIIPPESYSTLANSNDRFSAITLLQHKARLLEAETEARRRAEEFSLQMASLVEWSDDAIISKSLEGIIQSWNKGAERIFGYTSEEMIGKPVTILIPADKQDEETRILEQLRCGRRIDHFETVRVTKAGKLVDISLTVSPIKDRSGRIIGASKIARDITERKQAEEKMREQSEMIATLNKIGRILSADLNLQNVVQTVTDAATELTGAKFGAFFYNIQDQNGESYMLFTISGVPQEAFGHFPMPRNTDLFGPTFRGEGTICIDNVRKDPRYGRNSPYYGMPPGHLPVTSYLAVPVISRSGEVLGGLFFGHPGEGVFTAHQAELVKGLALQAAIAMDNAKLYELSQWEKAKAEEANRAKDEFLATVSHELRTPLNAILGWSYLLRSANPEGEVLAQAIESIDRNAKSQAQLIEDILDVSRVITGKLRLHEGPVDLMSVIQAALDSVQLAADSKGIIMRVTFDPAVRQVSGDATRLQQIVWNLLSNAIKFTPGGGRVEVRLERAAGAARITISDTGEGISKKFLPFIFERFRQADGSSTRIHGGLGLGLAIVKHLVELHGGTIQAASEGEGRGATFTIQLPLKVAGESRPEEGIRSLRPDEPFRHSQRANPSLEGLKILIVDDDKDTLDMLASVLNGCQAEVQAVSSVAEAIAVLLWYKPDVLVSDLAMPQEDGYSLINQVRNLETETRKQILAVALTALVRVEDRIRALSEGFNLFVPKPIDPDELISAIANLTRSKRPSGFQT